MHHYHRISTPCRVMGCLCMGLVDDLLLRFDSLFLVSPITPNFSIEKSQWCAHDQSSPPPGHINIATSFVFTSSRFLAHASMSASSMKATAVLPFLGS